MRDLLLMLHFTGIVIGAGSGFALFVIGFLSKSFSNEYKEEVLVKLFPLRYISYIGLFILVSSGLLLLSPYMMLVSNNAWLQTKFFCVSIIILASVFGAFQMLNVSRNKIAPAIAFKKLGLAGKLSFAMSIAVIISAVNVFH